MASVDYANRYAETDWQATMRLALAFQALDDVRSLQFNAAARGTVRKPVEDFDVPMGC